MDLNLLVSAQVVDRERKAACDTTLKPESERMQPAVEGQRVNVGEERIEKIASQPGFLLFVKVVTVGQVLLG